MNPIETALAVMRGEIPGMTDDKSKQWAADWLMNRGFGKPAPTMTFATAAVRDRHPDCKPAYAELTGTQLHHAIVYCTLHDLNEVRFRDWLRDTVSTRFGPDAHQPPITLHVLT